MSQNKTVTLYGVEAEIPEGPLQQYLNLYIQGCPAPDGKRPDREFMLSCLESQAVELFATTALCRWSDQLMLERLSNPCNYEKVAGAKKQYLA